MMTKDEEIMQAYHDAKQASGVELIACHRCKCIHLLLKDDDGVAFGEGSFELKSAELFLENYLKCIESLRAMENPQ